jgi:hypothetical protein
MTKPNPSCRWQRALPIAVVLLVLFVGFGWPLIDIQFRLWKNRAIAAQLVESLQTRFPGAEFRGIASYEREVVYILVGGGLDPKNRPDVEQWLRQLKVEKKVAPAIWLRYPESMGEEKDTIKF